MYRNHAVKIMRPSRGMNEVAKNVRSLDCGKSSADAPLGRVISRQFSATSGFEFLTTRAGRIALAELGLEIEEFISKSGSNRPVNNS